MKSWGTFKSEMKAKRRQTGDGVGKKNEEGNVLERQKLVNQTNYNRFLKKNMKNYTVE